MAKYRSRHIVDAEPFDRVKHSDRIRMLDGVPHMPCGTILTIWIPAIAGGMVINGHYYMSAEDFNNMYELV